MSNPKIFHHSNLPFFLLVIATSLLHLSSSIPPETLASGSSLSVERPNDILTSPDHAFAAGFRSVGDNAVCFAVWFTQPNTFTPVWMANRNQPINGKKSSLSLSRDGNLVLFDAGYNTIWTTNTTSKYPTQLRLSNEGNLMLQNNQNLTLWQSFDHPTDTLLPNQQFRRNTPLKAARSKTNYSSGFYSLSFGGDDNVLKLAYNVPGIGSIYWPRPELHVWQIGRTTFNAARIAMFDSWGRFRSSDNLEFSAWDIGLGPKRRLRLDFDGNLRLYSLDKKSSSWEVSWQAELRSCRIHGLCGPNGLCSESNRGRQCSCLPGFKMKDPTDWSLGCEPIFNLPCDIARDFSNFIQLQHVDFFGYDIGFYDNITFGECESKCLNTCSCKAFMFRFNNSVWNCYLKELLLNGLRLSNYVATTYLKVPKNFSDLNGNSPVQTGLNCSAEEARVELPRTFAKGEEHASSLKWPFRIMCVIGVVEVTCIFVAWWYFSKDEGISISSATGFNRFTYAELKKATSNFREEIGRGSCGVVYKGVLSDHRVVAIKRLEGINQGEGQFLAEVSLIGRINHMNLIHMLGFCAERNHRLLVYEYMKHGSLAESLSTNALDWEKRFDIALGTAKGLAYLHEECLEWVLHCDIKPQNILLDDNYKARVGDFGLSKLLDRCGVERSVFSTIRGTRGYMAPEWIMNLPITSKVDVYSYGVVVLEMVGGQRLVRNGSENGRLVPWVRNVMMGEGSVMKGRVEEIMDREIEGGFDVNKMERLVRVALQCVEEDRDARPTMRQVVEMLSSLNGCEHC